MKLDLDSVGHISLYRSRIDSFARGSGSPDYAIYLVLKRHPAPVVAERIILMSNAAGHKAAPDCKNQDNEENDKSVLCVANIPFEKMLVIATYKYRENDGNNKDAFVKKTETLVHDVESNVLHCK